MDPDIHVLPIEDRREHEESRDCWCTPSITYDPATMTAAVVIHHSADARELIERHGIN